MLEGLEIAEDIVLLIAIFVVPFLLWGIVAIYRKLQDLSAQLVELEVEIHSIYELEERAFIKDIDIE